MAELGLRKITKGQSLLSYNGLEIVDSHDCPRSDDEDEEQKEKKESKCFGVLS